MAERLYCRKGHSWTPTFPVEVWPPDFRSACPVCGDAPIGPGDATVTTVWVMIVLECVFLLVGLGLLLGSEPTMPFGILVLILAVIVPIAGLVMWFARMKTQKMASIADAMGFAFMPRLTVDSLRAAAPFQLFQLGHTRKAANAMQGRVGDCDVLFVEYQYTIGSGKSAHTHYNSAVILFDGAPGVPDFQLAPKTFFDKIVGLFSHNAIELPDAVEFSKRCKLTGPNASALRETFHPDLAHHLGRDGRWFIQSLDGQLLLYRTPLVRPDRCPGLVTDALEIRDLLRGTGGRPD